MIVMHVISFPHTKKGPNLSQRFLEDFKKTI